MAQVQEPLLQLPPMKSNIHVEQLFSFVDIECILHNLITYLVCRFLWVYEVDLRIKLYQRLSRNTPLVC